MSAASEYPTYFLEQAIRTYIVGKVVLDIGSVNHSFGNFITRNWIFDFILKEAAFVQGINIEAAEVEKAQAAGYNILCADAETYRADRKFDAVLAGDLIEHLSNPGLFLQCSKANLLPGGKLILTTPNTFSLERLYLSFLRLTNDPQTHRLHVCYHTPSTLIALAKRAGFRHVATEYVNLNLGGQSRFIRLLLKLNGAITAVLPKFKITMIMVFEAPDLQ